MSKFILIFILLPVMACAQLIEIPLPSPGRLGMISTLGASEMPLEAMRYSLNVDVFTKPGVLQKRVGLQNYSGTNLHLYGVSGYYNPYDNHRLVVGVHDSTFVWFDSTGRAHPSLVGHFFVSDTFTTNPDIGVPGLVFPYRDTYHDWLSRWDILFHCDGKSMPIVFTTSQTFLFRDSADTANAGISTFDTLGFGPRVVSLGLEAPGQLRVGLTDLGGPNSGEYRYAYAHWDKTDSTYGGMSRFSALVSPRNETPYLTQFEKHDIIDTIMWKLLLRQKQDGSNKIFVIDTLKIGMLDTMITNVIVVPNYPPGYPANAVLNYQYFIKIGAWDGDPIDSIGYLNTTYAGYNTMLIIISHLIDSLAIMPTMVDSVTVTKTAGQYSLSIQSKLPCQSFTTAVDTGSRISIILDSTNWKAAGTPLVYLDTMPDSLLTVKWDPSEIDTTIRTPGGLLPDSLTTSGGSQSVTTASGYHAMIDSVYPIKYSYYDPATGFESPPGPTYYTTLSDSSGIEDTAVFRSVSTGWPADGRPEWIRLYQGVMHSDVTGFGDTMYWYGLYQIRTNDSARTIIWGNWTDASVATLLDTSTITVDTIYDYQLFVNAAGNSIMRPPYCYDLQIPFSDMEYAHFRFYGIGDPLGPNNIYFTPVDTISWYPLDYFEIEPGVDEFVALEELYGTLYAFKHNSIWFIAGFDAELETPWGKIIDTDVEVRQLTSKYGAVSRENVCKYNDAIYFLTPKGEVMVIDEQGLGELSTPIQNWIDTLFKATSVSGVMQADYVAFDKYAHLFVADEQVKIINDSSGRLMSFHIPSQTWGEQEYTSFIPTRMFKYDSTEGLVGTDVELYFAEGTGYFKQEYPTGHTSDAAGNFEWAAEFSMPGDGVNFFSINQINLRHEPRSLWWLRYSIYDSNGDSLIAGSVYQYGDHYRFIRWDMLPHDLTMYPSIRLWGKSGETTGGGEPQPIPNLFEIESIIFTIRNQGLIYAQ